MKNKFLLALVISVFGTANIAMAGSISENLNKAAESAEQVENMVDSAGEADEMAADKAQDEIDEMGETAKEEASDAVDEMVEKATSE